MTLPRPAKRGEGFLIALVALCALSAQAKTRPAKKTAAPRAGFLDEILIERINDGVLKADGAPVGAGYSASVGTRLDLSPEGRTVLKFGRQAAVLVRGPATFEIMRSPRPGLSVIRGRLLVALTGVKGAFSVYARSLYAVSRDADFYMNLGGREDLYVCACRGTLHLTDDMPEGYRKMLAATDGHKGVGFRFSRIDGINRAIEADHPLEGHDDDELAALREIAAK